MARTRISPDAATCEACLDDVFDPDSRFHLYPFVTCTHCGPRFTLTRKLPYDRAQTSMAPFRDVRRLRAGLWRSLQPPLSRRTDRLSELRAAPVPRADASSLRLRAGRIVALKGIGGFHLMCDARNAAVAELRAARARDAKPFAIMVANEASVALSPSRTPRTCAAAPRARPIVLVRDRAGLPDVVAPAWRGSA